MEWALGFAASGDLRQIELLGASGQQSLATVDALTTVGLPIAKSQGRKRIRYDGGFSSWDTVSADDYLAAFGIQVSSDLSNRHVVFALTSSNGVAIHVPALVLMRAFFKPALPVFRAMFTPANIDLLSFVDFASSPPIVVIDDVACAKRIADTKDGASKEKAIQWLQSSLSARRAAQSVHQHALTGRLSMQLPQGRTRIIFHGRLLNGQLYATQASLISVHVADEDSITGTSEVFIFHAKADTKRDALAAASKFEVPLRPDGHSAVSQEEWEAVEPLLRGRKNAKSIHSKHDILNAILQKLSSGMSWKAVPKGTLTMTDITSTFRRWVASGRLKNVLTYLQESRAQAN